VKHKPPVCEKVVGIVGDTHSPLARERYLHSDARGQDMRQDRVLHTILVQLFPLPLSCPVHRLHPTRAFDWFPVGTQHRVEPTGRRKHEFADLKVVKDLAEPRGVSLGLHLENFDDEGHVKSNSIEATQRRGIVQDPQELVDVFLTIVACSHPYFQIFSVSAEQFRV
jgi:hypothetical protein